MGPGENENKVEHEHEYEHEYECFMGCYSALSAVKKTGIYEAFGRVRPLLTRRGAAKSTL